MDRAQALMRRDNQVATHPPEDIEREEAARFRLSSVRALNLDPTDP
jgi:hypothetical protein